MKRIVKIYEEGKAGSITFESPSEAISFLQQEQLAKEPKKEGGAGWQDSEELPREELPREGIAALRSEIADLRSDIIEGMNGMIKLLFPYKVYPLGTVVMLPWTASNERRMAEFEKKIAADRPGGVQ